MINDAITELEPLVGVRAACRATGRPQANHYRRHRQSPKPPRPVRIDIYSRYVVGWMVAERESAALAEKLLADTITKPGASYTS
jgi:transposase InsO family protein